MDAFPERAKVLFDQRRDDLAVDELRRLVEQDPDDAWARGSMALCLSFRGDHRGALAEAARAVELDPEEPFPHYALSIVQRNSGQPRDALHSVNESIRLDPESPDAYVQKAIVHLDLEEGEAALAAADAGLRVDPCHVNSYCMRSDALAHLGRTTESRSAALAALEHDPQKPEAHSALGWSVLIEGDARRAERHFRDALRLDPTLDDAVAGYDAALKARHPLYRLLRNFLGRVTRRRTVSSST